MDNIFWSNIKTHLLYWFYEVYYEWTVHTLYLKCFCNEACNPSWASIGYMFFDFLGISCSIRPKSPSVRIRVHDMMYFTLKKKLVRHMMKFWSKKHYGGVNYCGRLSMKCNNWLYSTQTWGIGYFHVCKPVNPIVPALPPWYAFLSATILRLPLYSRAINIANSFASVPELTKYATCGTPNHEMFHSYIHNWNYVRFDRTQIDSILPWDCQAFWRWVPLRIRQWHDVSIWWLCAGVTWSAPPQHWQYPGGNGHMTLSQYPQSNRGISSHARHTDTASFPPQCWAVNTVKMKILQSPCQLIIVILSLSRCL